MRRLGRAHELGGAGGIYVLQAAIIACHAQARTAGDTDWSRIAGLYAELAAVVRSPIIDLNRAVAVGMAEGPEAALAIVDRLVREPALKTYHLLGSVRGDLLHKLGRYEEARAAFEAAAGLAGNKREQDLLRRPMLRCHRDPMCASRGGKGGRLMDVLSLADRRLPITD